MTLPMKPIITPELLSSILQKSTRCTQATLLAFGIEGYPMLSSGTLQYFVEAGYALKKVKFEGTLKQFQKKLDVTKDYHIKTPGHAIAVRNGILIDTAARGWDGRPIEAVWEVL